MFIRLLTISLLAVAVTIAGPAWSYDEAIAESYAKLFTPVKGAGAGKALHLIPPNACRMGRSGIAATKKFT